MSPSQFMRGTERHPSLVSPGMLSSSASSPVTSPGGFLLNTPGNGFQSPIYSTHSNFLYSTPSRSLAPKALFSTGGSDHRKRHAADVTSLDITKPNENVNGNAYDDQADTVGGLAMQAEEYVRAHSGALMSPLH